MFKKVCIIGCGLIGSSIARAIKKKKLSSLALAVMDEREKDSEKNISDLYDPNKMPLGLKNLHQKIDQEVELCYKTNDISSDNTIQIFSVALIIGGALGNALDRIIFGAVADFLNMSCCGFRNPFSFNVADISIFMGAFALLFYSKKEDYQT